MQVIQRCMRASPGKTLGRILLFGDANDAGSVGRLLHKYDSDHRAISVGATPLTLQGHLDAWSNAGGARDQCDAKATQFKEAIKATIVACATRDERVEAIAKGFLKFAWAEIKAKGPTARSTSYARYFKRNDNKKFKYRLKGVTFERKANEHFSQVRHDFHTEGATNWFHTEKLRNLHRALPIWNGDPTPPSERKPRKAPMTALQRMEQMHAIYERTGRLPRQNSKDPEEAACAQYLSEALGTTYRNCRKKLGDARFEYELAWYKSKKVTAVPKTNQEWKRLYYAWFADPKNENVPPNQRSTDPDEKALAANPAPFIRGQVDYAEIKDGNVTVTDWKTARGMLPRDGVRASTQARLYGWLALLCLGGRDTEEVTVEFRYVRWGARRSVTYAAAELDAFWRLAICMRTWGSTKQIQQCSSAPHAPSGAAGGCELRAGGPARRGRGAVAFAHGLPDLEHVKWLPDQHPDPARHGACAGGTGFFASRALEVLRGRPPPLRRRHRTPRRGHGLPVPPQPQAHLP